MREFCSKSLSSYYKHGLGSIIDLKEDYVQKLWKIFPNLCFCSLARLADCVCLRV